MYACMQAYTLLPTSDVQRIGLNSSPISGVRLLCIPNRLTNTADMAVATVRLPVLILVVLILSDYCCSLAGAIHQYRTPDPS